MDSKKKCKYCGELKPESGFRKGRLKCGDCQAKAMKEYRKKNPDKIKQHEEKRKGSVNRMINCVKFNLKRSFGMTLEDRVALMDKQKGCCAICGASLINPEFHKMDLNVDHDHTTGKIRGLLCGNCNTAIGSLKDSPELLRKAATYLEVK